MRFNRWQKTVMNWNCCFGLNTNIPVTDWPKEAVQRPGGYVHTIHVIRATALPDRRGRLELHIRRVSVSPTTKRKAIHQLLAGKYEDDGYILGTSLKDPEQFSGVWVLEFGLSGGDQFCDTAIVLVRQVLERLGVKDERGYTLADFTVTQETFVQLDDAWISFARWLRIQHRLPILSSADA